MNKLLSVFQMSLFSLVTRPRPQRLDGNETEKFYWNVSHLEVKKTIYEKTAHTFLYDKKEPH